jgi:hypothetical protein
MSTTRGPFLNVDLDLYDKGGLRELVRAMEPGMFVMHEAEDFASLELATGTTPGLDSVLNGLTDIVEALPRPARTLWNKCQRRVMNVGVESVSAPAVLSIPLRTLKRLIAIGAELELTLYPSRPAQIRQGGSKPSKSPRRKRTSPGS